MRRPPLSRLCGDALRRCAAPSAARHAPSAELRAPPLRGATHAPRALRAGFLPEVRELIKDTRPKNKHDIEHDTGWPEGAPPYS